MIIYSPMTSALDYDLDELDYKILNLIANDARISFLEVARIAGVSGAAVHQRVQKMTSAGIITGSQLKLNMEAIGYEITAWLLIGFDRTLQENMLLESLSMIPNVVECHSLVGEYDYLIKVHVRSNAHLLDMVRRNFKSHGGIRFKVIQSYGEQFNRQMSFHTIRVPKNKIDTKSGKKI